MRDRFAAGVAASVAAEAVFVGLLSVVTALRAGDPWMPVRLPGALVLGPAAVSPPGVVPGDIALGVAMHLGLSVLVGLVYAALLPRVGASPLVGGLLAALVLFLLGFWILPETFPDRLAPFRLPPLALALNGLAHGVYGVVLGRVYGRLAGRRTSPPRGAPRST